MYHHHILGSLMRKHPASDALDSYCRLEKLDRKTLLSSMAKTRKNNRPSDAILKKPSLLKAEE